MHNRPNIPGLLHDVIISYVILYRIFIQFVVQVTFLHHEHPQERDGLSYCNQNEVDMALGLAAYHVRQGIPEEKITILITYASQMYKLQDSRRRRFNTQRNVRITVVDNFQEENEVILISEPRSKQHEIVDRILGNTMSLYQERDVVSTCPQTCNFSRPLWAQLGKVLSENGQIARIRFPFMLHSP